MKRELYPDLNVDVVELLIKRLEENEEEPEWFDMHTWGQRLPAKGSRVLQAKNFITGVFFQGCNTTACLAGSAGIIAKTMKWDWANRDDGYVNLIPVNPEENAEMAGSRALGIPLHVGERLFYNARWPRAVARMDGTDAEKAVVLLRRLLDDQAIY